MTLRDMFLVNKKLEHDYKYAFQEAFGVSLSKFMAPYTGFMLPEFDDYIKTPEGVSIHDYLLENNKKGLEVVKKLIGM